MRKIIRSIAAIPFIVFSTSNFAAPAAVPYNFTAATPARAAEVNANFQALVDAINAQTTAINTQIAQINSQVTAINAKNAPGTVIAFAGPTCPTGTFPANGAAVSRTTYATLFNTIGTAHGIGDGIATFNLPDYRGLFLRGLDGVSTNDPDSATRIAMGVGGNVGNTVGSVQPDAMQGHWHRQAGNYMTTGNALPYLFTAGSSVQGNGNQSANNAYSAENRFMDNSIHSPVTDTVNGAPRTSSETRPKNAYVNYCVYY